MKRKGILLTAILFVTIMTNAQTNYLTIDKDVRLPKDSIENISLIKNLNDFLLSIKEDKGVENWVVPEEKIETQILIDEIQSFAGNDTINYKPYLISLEAFSDRTSYSAQIAYISLDSSQPLHALFEFIVHKKDENFLFSSPLIRNTRNWHTKTDGHLVFYYQNKNTEDVVNQHIKYIKEYDNMLNVTTKTEYYFCDDCESLTQVLRMAGILYKINYNGLTWNGISFVVNDKILLLQTQRQSRKSIVDPHYLFHFRADMATPENNNYYMVCAGANVYSGCWGMNWQEIKTLFKEKMFENKKQNWLQLYFDRHNFGESRAEYLFVTTFINGLLIEKAEKEQGFHAVKKLLASGDMYKDKDAFFKILEEITGINEKNFNKKVGKLINDSMRSI